MSSKSATWKKFLSPVWFTFAGVGFMLAMLGQPQAASASTRYYNYNYVSTNGNCLNVRTGPSTYCRSVNCLANGSRLPRIVSSAYYNGYSKLADGTFVYSQYISSTRPSGGSYNPGGGVGGRYTLSLGSQGSAVSQLQRALGLNATGYYGPVTESAVMKFQSRYGLTADGVAGPRTLSAIDNNYGG
ncbi:MAG: peptidoglycan-binding protein [Nostocaceae cyanobacterium]|nr:peptidoglycan-binding protein [Nostocaceae cyanobacterium]